jgi:glyoxylase-like metal-dependent hydrolase (beta-lactamase superfamily II)
MIRKTFPVPPLGCNCTILGDPVTKQAIVVDPGGDSQRILRTVSELGLTVVAIYHTHAHFDHVLASGAVKQATGAPICLHEADQELWDLLEVQCRLFGVGYRAAPKPDHLMKDEDKISVGGMRGVALHTPGHTPGSLSLHFPEDRLVLAGDTLFQGAIGRTDLWGGDFKAIERSIRERLYTLDEQTHVVTGHGPETMIGYEREENSFIRA